MCTNNSACSDNHSHCTNQGNRSVGTGYIILIVLYILLAKKASASGESKTQKENLVIMDKLYNELAHIGRAVTISEFQANSEYASTLSNQKISALFKKMKEAGKIVKTTEKKKSYFSIVAE